MLQGKKIIVGVTGGIAAYKSAILVREFVRRGAEVRVVMTERAKDFITPLTLATLSQHPVLVENFDATNGAWNSHVSLGVWADAYVIAPATANSIAKMANGVADNLLLTTYLSARCHVFVAPAMDLDMYKHEATQQNLSLLRERGVTLIEPASGFLASGLEGKGRMEEPEVIADCVERYFAKNLPLKGKTVLVTAGPTYENIDPVRFIGNYSSGKMGFALAERCAEEGAHVLLVSGPVGLSVNNSGIERIDVKNAEEMWNAVSERFGSVDGAILCAAVADYTPTMVADRKLKRDKGELTIALRPTRDIAASLGERKREGQFLVGFALETNNELNNAKEKLVRKNLDFIVLNSMNDSGAGFGVDTNKVTLIDRDGGVCAYPLMDKHEVAKNIVSHLEKLLGCV